MARFVGELTYKDKVEQVCGGIQRMSQRDEAMTPENVRFLLKRSSGHFGIFWTCRIPSTPFYVDFHLTFCTWDADTYEDPTSPSEDEVASGLQRFARAFGKEMWPLLEKPNIAWPLREIDNGTRVRTLLYLVRDRTMMTPFCRTRDSFINWYSLDLARHTVHVTTDPHFSVDHVYGMRLIPN